MRPDSYNSAQQSIIEDKRREQNIDTRDEK